MRIYQALRTKGARKMSDTEDQSFEAALNELIKRYEKHNTSIKEMTDALEDAIALLESDDDDDDDTEDA